MWYWYKDRHTDEWDRIESPEINSPTYGQIIFDKGVKTISMGKRQSFQQMMLRILHIHMQNNEAAT